ncbi:hypothetical protein Tco_0273336, partial [Tanacetum coccineum]
GEGSGHPSESQPPPSTAQPTNEEPIPNVTSEPIPNVPDEAVYEWDDRVERATSTAASLDAEQASGSPSAAKVLVDADKENVHTYTRKRRAVSLGSGGISTASMLFSTAEESVSTAGASMPVSTTGMVQEVNISIPSPVVVKIKEKRNWIRKKDKGWLEFMKQLNLLLRKNEKTLKQELKLMKRYLGDYKQRKGTTEAKRNKPMTQSQQRNYMINYIKHMGSHTLQQLKRYSFNELKELFETTIKNVNTFKPMETEDREGTSELAAGSSQATIIDFAEVGSSKRAAEA